MEQGKVVYPPGRKTFGFILFVFSTIRLLLTYGTFKNAWYLIIEGYRPATSFETLVVVGQVLLYLTVYIVVIIFSVVLIRQRSIKQKHSWLIFVVVLWMILEVPLYPCEFGMSHHTFWESHRLHFHL
jgi:hypothetical protein